MSPFNENGKIWMNGDIILWKDANIHMASHVIHYGSSIFEGFRAYKSSKGPITKILQDAFFSYIKGKRKDKFNWLTYV